MHVVVVLFAPPVRPREQPPPLRLSAMLRESVLPAPAAQAGAAPSGAPIPEPAAKREPRPQPPKVQSPFPPLQGPEARPLAPPDLKSPAVRAGDEPAQARPAVPSVAAPPLAAAANPAAAVPGEAKGEREAPRPPASAPLFAGQASDGELVAQYQNQLAGIVETRKLKRYPNEAMQNGWEGAATVLLKIGSDGKVAGVETSTSSGHETLDEQARISISRAKPFVQIPEGLKGKAFEARVRVVFSLKN